jgi:hypothetical protein
MVSQDVGITFGVVIFGLTLFGLFSTAIILHEKKDRPRRRALREAAKLPISPNAQFDPLRRLDLG